MIGLVLAAVLATAAAPPAQPLAEAEHAIAAGRIDQARIMIGNAVKAGARGAEVDRLLAELSFAAGDFALALGQYETLLAADAANSLYAERAGISAFRTGDIQRALRLLDLATSSPDASWGAWNARAVVADNLGDWDLSGSAYGRAAALSPDHPQILNNMGWSMLLQGRWEEGLALLERAALLNSDSPQIADNLWLARAALASELPRRRPRESDEEWAARLNDVGVIASIRGDRGRAVAAFARAIEARSSWFERAANNLAQLEGRK